MRALNSVAQQAKAYSPDLMAAIAASPCTFPSCRATPKRRCHNGFGVHVQYHAVRVRAGRTLLAQSADQTATP